MITIPNQSSVAEAFMEFDENGRMKPSSYYDRIVDVMEELVRFTVLTRAHARQLVDRYSERKASGVPIDTANDLSAIAIRSASWQYLTSAECRNCDFAKSKKPFAKPQFHRVTDS